MRIRFIYVLIFLLKSLTGFAQCDPEGILLELQATTDLNGFLYGETGCIQAATIGSPLTFTGGVLDITTGNLTAASSKVSVTGGTGAVIGSGATVDVVPGNILLSTLGGSLNLSQIAQGGATLNQLLQWNGSTWTPATVSATTDLTFSGTSSPVTLNSSTGTDVTFTAGTGVSLSATSSNTTITNTAPDQTVSITGAGINVASGTYPNFTITGTEVDGSTTNELQTYSHSGTTTYINTLSNGGGSWSITGGGIAAISQTGGAVTVTATEVDGSTTNELQTLANTSTGTTHVSTLSNSGGSLTLSEGSGITIATTGTSLNGIATITAVDVSATNELQTIANTSAATTHTATLSSSGGSIQLVEGSGITLTTTGTSLDGIVTIASTTTGTLTGNGVAPRVPYYSGTTAFANTAGFNYDATNGFLQISTQATPATSTATLDLRKDAVTGTWEYLRATANTSGNLISTVFNSRNLSGSGNTIQSLVVGGSNAGDPMTQYTVSTVGTWSVGVDNSDGDAFRILNQATPSDGSVSGEGIRIETGTVSKVGINKTVAIEVLDVGGNVRGEMWKNVSTTGAIGTYSLGTGAGTGATINSSNSAWWGNGGYLYFTSGTTPATDATVATVTMAAGYKYNTRASAIVQGKDLNGNLTGWGTTYDNTTGILSIKYKGTLPASTIIQINILATGL